MKKKLLKFGCTCLCVLMAASTLFACGRPSDPDDKNNYEDASSSDVIQIAIQNAGYGTKWLTDAMKLYTDETGVKFAKPIVYAAYGQTNTASQNSSNNNVDLYFDIYESTALYGHLNQGVALTDGKADVMYVDISDVYDSVAEGYGDPNLKIKDLVTDFSYNNFTWKDGKQYAFSWARGIEGIIYNKNYFVQHKLDVPKTTDQLIALCDTIKNLNVINPNDYKKVYAFNWSDGYWGQCSISWMFQYEGVEAYNNYCQGKDPTGKYSPEIYRLKGKEYAYEIIGQIIDVNNGYSNPACSGYTFSQNQVKFLDGGAFMMVNGDWLTREMKANFKDDMIDVEFMKMPVNSKIIEKLSTVNDDATLIKVIDYIDGVSTEKPAGVSDEDIQYVRQARNMCFTQQIIHNAYIPYYSNCVSKVKDFIKFLYRKDVQMMIANTSYGNMFPTKYDFSNEEGYSNFDALKKSADKLFTSETIFLGREARYPLYYIAGCVHDLGAVTSMGLDHSSGSYRTASQLVQASYNKYKDQFAEWMRQAGVSNP